MTALGKIFSIALFLFLTGQAVFAPTDTVAAGRQVEQARYDLPENLLVNQYGEKRTLNDFIGQNYAAITFTYTTCTTICPVLDGIFKNLQARLNDDLTAKTKLITISIDPATDVPQRLLAHSRKLGAGPNWDFLTGEKRDVIAILKALDVYTTDIYNHPPTVLVVNKNQETWTRISNFPSARTIMTVLANY